MKKVGDGRAPSKSRGSRVINRAGSLSLNLFKQFLFLHSTAPASSKAKAKVFRKQTTSRAKASPLHPMTIENLPDEILSNIFIRLLSKQLAQMRSLSKYWNAHLSESSFIKSHLHLSIHNNNDRILLLFHGKGKSSSILFTAKSIQSPHLELAHFIKLPVYPQSEYTSGIRVIGSVNGLICSSDNNKSVIQIWNPSLSAVLTLPPYSIPFSHEHDRIKIQFRFGYDPKTDDYKVVKLTGVCGALFSIKRWLQVEVYSMRKGFWEFISGRFPSHMISATIDDHVCVDGHDGHLHWLGCKPDAVRTMERVIIAFDLGSETFHEIPLPDSILDIDCANIVSVLAGKLCVMSSSCAVPRKDDAYEVWVMEEYGMPESWVRRHVFMRFEGCTYPFGITSRGEFLMESGGHLVLYDPTANERKILENHPPEEHYVNRIVEYVDSLVWVAPAEHDLVNGGGQS